MNEREAIPRTLALVKRIAPGAIAQADQVLGCAMAKFTKSIWPELALQFSTLTNSGFPVEFSWSSRDPSLRFTFEAAPAETPDDHRLPEALKALAERGASGFHAARDLQKAQIGAPLRFGAWIGARCAGVETTYKLYVETPSGPATDAWAKSVLSSAVAPLRFPFLEWRMAGLDAGGNIELYARATNIDAATLRAIVLRLEADPEAFLAPMRRLVRQDEPTAVAGVSISIDASGAFIGFTFFALAKHLYASDRCVREALLAAADRLGVETALYEALSDGRDDGLWRHGMIGVGMQRGGAIWLQAGLRPT